MPTRNSPKSSEKEDNKTFHIPGADGGVETGVVITGVALLMLPLPDVSVA